MKAFTKIAAAFTLSAAIGLNGCATRQPLTQDEIDAKRVNHALTKLPRECEALKKKHIGWENLKITRIEWSRQSALNTYRTPEKIDRINTKYDAKVQRIKDQANAASATVRANRAEIIEATKLSATIDATPKAIKGAREKALSACTL